jgi:hypothetical protein
VITVGVDLAAEPDAFVECVVAHRDGAVTAPAALSTSGVRSCIARPISIAATCIRSVRSALPPTGSPTQRCDAALLPRLGVEDRSGAGRVVEANPAGSLQIWELPHRGCNERPMTIPSEFAAQARREGWISLPDPALEALRGSPAIRRP